LRDEYRADIDIHKLAAELAVDAIVPAERLRSEIATRFARYADKRSPRPPKKHLVPPV
jgi:acetyl-CoA carboxylase carboxyltransferase component